MALKEAANTSPTPLNNAASAMIAILIPPSIPLILYALVSGASVASLFVSGVLPGLSITAVFILVCNLSARLRGFPSARERFDWTAFRRVALRATPALAPRF